MSDNPVIVAIREIGRGPVLAISDDCEENGRPAVDAVLLCGVTLLQFMEKAADRGASEHVVYHLGWKYALDL